MDVNGVLSRKHGGKFFAFMHRNRGITVDQGLEKKIPGKRGGEYLDINDETRGTADGLSDLPFNRTFRGGVREMRPKKKKECDRTLQDALDEETL